MAELEKTDVNVPEEVDVSTEDPKSKKKEKKEKEPSPKKNAKKAGQDPSEYTYIVKNRKARALTKHRKAVVIALIVLGAGILVAGLFYAFYRAVDVNNFRIFVDSSGSRVLSLSANASMEPSSELIELIGPSNMTNTTMASGRNPEETTAIEDVILDIIKAEGSATTINDRFIAGTFYVKNVTTDPKTYTERITIEQADKGTAKALRVMLIKNDVITVYAYPVTDEKGDVVYDEEGNPVCEEVVPLNKKSYYYPYTERTLVKDDEGEYHVDVADDGKPWMTETFYNDNGNYERYAMLNEGNVIEAQEVIRYSVVIWFEGWDDQCKDPILGGQVRMMLSFACDD